MSSDTQGGARRAPEEQAEEARRMEALGRLASGIAHDFNNVLAAIRGHGQIALRSLDAMAAPAREDDAATVPVERAALAQLRDDVAAIDDSARRATSLTRQLGTLARVGDGGVAPLELGAFAAELYGLARRLVPATVGMTLAPPGEPVPAQANEAALLQAAVELLLDVRDALEGSGEIGIAAVRADEDSRAALVLTHTARRAHLPGTRTCRLVGELLARSGGELRLDGTSGTMTLLLPLHAAPDAQARSDDGARALAAQGTTVLLVEDDAAVRRIARTVLERLGYRVLPAGDGAEALRMVELLASDDVTPDLLVTDVTMPAMNGPELAAELRRRAPGLGVLYMSGLGEPATAGAEPAAGREDFLQKPFTLDELAARVAGLLARP